MMADLWLGNIDETLTDEQIGEFLERYGFPPFDEIQRVHGAGSRPGAVVRFTTLPEEALRLLQPRIHNLYWNERALVAQLLPPPREE